MHKSFKFDCCDCINYKKCGKVEGINRPVYHAESIKEMKNQCNDFKQTEYFITPYSLAVISLLDCDLITDINDPKASEFWSRFSSQLENFGYHLSF